MMNKRQNVASVSAGWMLIILVCVIGANSAFARIVYSAGSGDWTTVSTWGAGGVPIANDTVVIQTGHTVTVANNLYNSNTYMFVVIVGTLDLGQVGKLGFTNTSKVIVETGGQILASGNGAQITLGVGNAEYKGQDEGNITGPSYINNGHHPSSGEGFGGCGCYGSGSIPLPIKLESFSAKQSGDKVVLKWTTVSEINFDYFTIERSTNGIDFADIERVKGHGDSNLRTEYILDDEYPRIGKNYYRLKSTDFDGYVEYFKVVMADYSGEKVFSIFPNPSDGTTLYYKMNFSLGENSTIVVYDNVGAKLSTTFAVDNNDTLVFLNPLKQGVYYMEIISSNFTKIERFVVR